MNTLVCVKRVPDAGANLTLTPDEQRIDTRHYGFTISPHEECAVEEAVRIQEQHGGNSTVLTLGPKEAVEQLRSSLAPGIDKGMLLETDGGEWGPVATAKAISQAVKDREAEGDVFDLIFFGNEAPDSGDYQVGMRVAYALKRPCVTSIKDIEIQDGKVIAKRETALGWEVFEVALPAVVTVKEGLNYPRYPSVPGKLKAKKKPVETLTPESHDEGLRKVRLIKPEEDVTEVEILGTGPEAAPKVVDIMRELGVL